jgi:two-component system OmpR family sensor kinase
MESELRALALLDRGDFYYVAWTANGDLNKQSKFAPTGMVYPGDEEPDGVAPLRTRGEFRELVHRAPSGSCIVVGASLAPMYAQLNRLAVHLTLAGLGVVVVGLAVGWWLVGQALKPIAHISTAAEKIASGDLSNRIEVTEGKSELGQLAAVLNNSFERLEKSFEQQRQFTADASHELRTPVSVILTQVQLALSRERKPEEYREILTTCERAAERMRKLVNQLLVLARVDSGEFELHREEYDLADIANESLEMIKPLATQKKVTLQPTVTSVKASVDAIKVGQVLINLLNNAVQHNPEGIEVRLSLQQEGDKAILRIRDNGVGIPQEAIAHLFDRFYRLEKSRTHVKGNTGLGLAISKAIVEAHGGEIRVKSVRGQGTEFTVELPLQAPPSKGKS